MLADGTSRCGEVFGDGGSGCPREKVGLGAADSGVCSVTGDEDEFADCWALALNVSSNETVITQCHIRIEQPRLSALPLSSTSKSSGSVAVVLVVVATRLLTIWRVPPSMGPTFAEHWRKK
jgi:hypothetical protein